MQLGLRVGADSTFAVRFAWLTGVRLFVLTLVLIVTTTIYLGDVATHAYSSKFALLTLAVAYGLTGLYALVLRVGRRLEGVAFLQMITDHLVWSAIVYISGGVASGATSLYGLTCLSGAVLLGMRGALFALLGGASAYALLCYAFINKHITPPPDQPSDAYATTWNEAAFPLVLNLLAVTAVTLLASYLAERLREADLRVAAANARAEQAERLAALGRLAAGLAHEIRNPLGAISASIELLHSGPHLANEDRELCSIIEREASRMNNLIGDMMDLARPKKPTKEVMDLAKLAREVVKLAATSGRGTDVIVRCEGPSEVLIVADTAQMRQVVWNLVRNAIQASSAGSEVLLRWSKQKDGGVLVEVHDCGVGIDLTTRERLFDAFFTTRSQGMGIGLAVVKRILDDHGFTVTVDSSE
ncbi:MAG TPA: histidine kinase dimerization/phospho-acceptor domain-containing protein, partial [Polyangium sp.]|nr:histidine kinase dimerization/phospho-acceptor domain-containing protein [Polyangium sp.]